MIGLCSAISLLAAVAFVVFLVLLAVRTRKKLDRSFAVFGAAASFVVFALCFVYIGVNYEPKPAEQMNESSPTASQHANVDKPVENVDNSPAVSSAPEIDAATSPAPAASAPVDDQVAADSVEPPADVAPPSPEPDAAPETVAVDDAAVRASLDAIIEAPDYAGAILYIVPANAAESDWDPVYIALADAWYYLEDFQKERVCANVGDVVRSILVDAGVSDDPLKIKVYFEDDAGARIAQSKTFGGYELED